MAFEEPADLIIHFGRVVEPPLRSHAESPLELAWEANLMATVEIPSAIPAEEMADTKEVCRLIAEGKRVTDSALRKRIYERSEQVRRRCSSSTG